jgi:hypothetical protein
MEKYKLLMSYSRSALIIAIHEQESVIKKAKESGEDLGYIDEANRFSRALRERYDWLCTEDVENNDRAPDKDYLFDRD